MKLYQIYWHPSQKPSLDHTPYYNPVPKTPNKRYLFFESKVIEDIVKHGMHKDCTHCGVVSPKYKEKIQHSRRWGTTIRNRAGVKPLNNKSIAFFCKQNPSTDVIRLTNNPPHSTFGFSEQFHKGMTEITIDMMKAIGIPYNIRKPQRQVIYFNFFLARPEILEDYVNNWLTPAINYLLTDDRAWADSHYPKELPKHLQDLYGIGHYPYYPFITERLISVYLDWNRKHTVKVY